MSYKKKMKIEQVIYSVISILGLACIGGCVGYVIGTIQKRMGGNISGLKLCVMALLALTAIFLSYTINICLHEIGHMIFGLMSGYEFNSLRFGKLMLAKENGKLRFCKYDMPGTGGQCIMIVPKVDVEKMPVVLYNLGGLFMNLFVFLIGIIVFAAVKASYVVVGMTFLIFAMTSLVILITNGLPFTQMGTDGANTIILYKDKFAREAFRNQLEVVRYLSQNYSVREMPEELFLFDKQIPMTNPLITAQAVNCCNYYSVSGKYEEAKEMALYILENAKSINQLHEKLLYGDVLFITMVIDKDMEAAKEQFKLHKKELTKAAGFISMQRVLYAYYSLVEFSEKKATQYAKLFENSVKNYPYPKDAAIEKEQFDLVAGVIKLENSISCEDGLTKIEKS